MKYLKTFIESISGTEVISPFGPAYGRPNFPFTGSKKDTKLSNGRRRKTNNDLTDDIYTIDDYNQIYQDYLKCGGKPLPDGYSEENIEIINNHLSKCGA